MAKFHSLSIRQIRRETADAVSIAFDVPDTLWPDFQYKQGQYLTLKLTINGEELRRSYSICTSPYSERELRIAVKEVKGGRASVFLNRQIKEGQKIEVMSPLGNFHSPLSGAHKKNYVLLAGGSGITPMMSIIKSVLYVEKQSSIILVYANRNKESIIFEGELNSIAGEYKDRFRQIAILDDLDGMKGGVSEKGPVTVALAAKITGGLGLNMKEAEFFICGPGPMMENVKSALENLGVGAEKIHIEYFAAVAEGVRVAENESESESENIEAEVEVLQFGSRHSFKLNTRGASVLDGALENGIDVPFSCKGAVCCTCRAKLLEGKVKMDANFALTDQEVAEGYILTCQSHPLSAKIVVDYDAV